MQNSLKNVWRKNGFVFKHNSHLKLVTSISYRKLYMKSVKCMCVFAIDGLFDQA